jgi:hypothetical protein
VIGQHPARRVVKNRSMRSNQCRFATNLRNASAYRQSVRKVF